ncbi:MAG: hypothetical protein ABFS02_02010 [Pseudomonadota bacterium]
MFKIASCPLNRAVRDDRQQKKAGCPTSGQGSFGSPKRREHDSRDHREIGNSHATQINTWKKAVFAMIPEAFARNSKRQEDDRQALIDELYKADRPTDDRQPRFI